MRRRFCVALVGASLIGLVTADHAASAQSVPMPRPAPHTRTRTPPPPTAEKPKPNEAPRRMAQAGAANAGPGSSAGLPLLKPTGVVRTAGTLTFDDKQRALIDKANAYLTGITTLIGNFVQVGPDGSRSEGKFYLQKPGRVRFEYNPPSPTELIADGSSVAIRDRRLNTQDVWPLSQTPLRFLVADRVDLLKDTAVIGASSDDTFATIVIEERQALGGTHRVMLMFGARDFQLRQWTITDPQGYDTTVALYNLDAKQKPDPSLFKIDFTRYLQ